MSSTTSQPIPTTGASSTSVGVDDATRKEQQQAAQVAQAAGGTLGVGVGVGMGAPALVRGHSEVCEMNKDVEHAQLDKFAEQTGMSMKQKEQVRHAWTRGRSQRAGRSPPAATPASAACPALVSSLFNSLRALCLRRSVALPVCSCGNTKRTLVRASALGAACWRQLAFALLQLQLLLLVASSSSSTHRLYLFFVMLLLCC